MVTIKVMESGDGGLMVEVEANPPLPLTDGQLDIEALSREQAAAMYAVRMMGDAGGVDGPLQGVVIAEGSL